MDCDAQPDRAFGRLLRSCRAAAGLTQEELAQRSGLSVRAICDMERSRTTRPFMRSVRLLAGALSLSDAARGQFIRTARYGTAGTEPPGDPAGSARPSAPVVVPRQLPTAVRHFTGRRNELQMLDRLLDQARADGHAVLISAIGGTAGVGKTTP